MLIECETSTALLEDLVRELSGKPLPEGQASELFGRHRGNIRDCLRELYDHWAARSENKKAA